MKRPLAVLLLLLPVLACADDLVTTTGEAFKNCRITRAEPDGLVVRHSKGITKIPFENLSTNLQQQYHYDANKAQAYQTDVQRQRTEANRSRAVDSALKDTCIQAMLEIVQVIDDNVALARVYYQTEEDRHCEVTEQKPVGLRRADGQQYKTTVRTQTRHEKVTHELPDLVCVAGIPGHLVDRDTYRTPIYYAGTYSYEAVTGAKRTVALYATSTDLAKNLLTGGNGKENEPTGVAKGKEDQGTSTGTGWFCPGGYVVTCHHVVAGKSRISIQSSTITKRKAKVVTKDEANDIAVLQVEDATNMPAGLPLCHDNAALGERVFTIGYPHIDLMGQSPKLSEGVVGSISGMMDDPRTLQVSVPVQAGNSGGPLLNKKGEVIGVVQSKLAAVRVFAWTGDLPENVNYAVKTAYVQPLLSSLPANSTAQTLPAEEADLEKLVERTQNSVVTVWAE